jgi:hypothetical protein
MVDYLPFSLLTDMSPKKQEFKVCPFCGNEPRYLPFRAGFYSERVICDNCEFHLPPEQWQQRVEE